MALPLKAFGARVALGVVHEQFAELGVAPPVCGLQATPAGSGPSEVDRAVDPHPVAEGLEAQGDRHGPLRHLGVADPPGSNCDRTHLVHPVADVTAQIGDPDPEALDDPGPLGNRHLELLVEDR